MKLLKFLTIAISYLAIIAFLSLLAAFAAVILIGGVQDNGYKFAGFLAYVLVYGAWSWAIYFVSSKATVLVDKLADEKTDKTSK